MAQVSETHFRLVTLGGTAVGKSAILKRFIFGNFCDRHRPTVEDLYSREYDVGSTVLKVTFLDTAGDMEFPAMRRLSIENGHAFLLVYCVDNTESFETVKHCLEEIRENKTNFQEIPIIIVGNKCDLSEDRRQVKKDDVSEWLYTELPRMQAKVLECSAKENINVKDVFKSFLQLAKIPTAPCEPPMHALRRRSSAHVAIGRTARFNLSLNSQQRENAVEGSSSQQQQQQAAQRATSKPRSKSLIRRASKKVAKFKDSSANHGSGGENDCIVS